MIYTLTTNPNLDYYCNVSTLKPGAINRAANERIEPGGKGINVSLVLRQLGVESCNLGFLAGQTGKMLESMMQEHCCRWLWLKEGMTRINVKITGQSETAVNGAGPALDDEAVEALLQELKLLKKGDVLVVSGKLQAAPEGAFLKILSAAKQAGAELVVDTSGAALRQSLACKPLFIKPNDEELCELFGKQTAAEAELIEMARTLVSEGAQYVLLSRGAKGALLIAQNAQSYRAELKNAPFAVQSTVGAGDSMTAGFLAGLAEGKPVQDAFALAVACGSATAFSPCLASRQMIGQVLPLVNVCPC